MTGYANRGTPGGRIDDLIRILGSVRRRWRMRILLKGASIVLAAGLVAFLGSAYGVEWFRFSPTAVTAFRWIAWGTVLALGAWFVVRPLLRRVTDEQVALYLEEHEPSLEAAILGAVAARDAAGADPAVAATPRMLERLVERAIVQARSVEEGRRIEKEALLRHGGVFGALTVAAVLLLLLGPSSLRTGVAALMPTRSAEEVNPYSIAVEPGDLTVARGSDQFVTAILQGFASDEVSLFTRAGENDPYQRFSMIPASAGEDGSAVPFELMLLNLQGDTDYFVESDGIRSPTYRIAVRDLPYVDRMQHEYRYPVYTGLDPRLVEDAGDIAALRGTRVAVTIEPTIPTPAGRILLDGGASVELIAEADGTLTGVLDVTAEGFYQVELALDDGTFVQGSPRYTIDLLTDASPMVRFETPGRDSPASPIEEVYLEIQADDDYGVREVLLAYSVNGGPEDTVAVFQDAGPPLTQLTVGHTLYLEDYEVEPGDVISYYAVARDQQGPAAEVKSDIYFLNIQPFRREFREMEQQGGPPQGGGGQGENEQRLSELQRQVVAATFNLDRDRDRYEETEFEESSASVALAQGRVREQVSTLVERMTNRGLTEAEDEFRTIAEMLPEALAAMDSAQVLLRGQSVREALAPEQQALRILQKAEETYEVYVGQQQQGGGGGGGGAQANAEDLADLFELELDKLRNQYETVQRGERQQQADEVDELMQRLNELARRQQQEAERQRARAAQGQQAGGGAGAQSQRELADETEETARQLERLARETNDRQLQETARQLQEAADAMRRSASQGGNAGAAESSRAQERLAEAQRRLQQSRESRVGDDARNAEERVQRLQQQQRDITEQVRNLPDDPTQRGEQVRRIQERKTEMAREVGELERDLDRLAGDARQDDPQAARELGEAAQSIRDSRLNQKILWSRGVVEQREREFARIFEEGLEEDLESLRRQVAEASEAADRLAEQEGMSEALDQARDLVRGIESLDRRLESQGQRPDSLQEGAEGGDRRLGSRPGEQGQEGQQGGQQQGQQGGQQQGQQGGQQQGQQGGQQQGQQGGQQQGQQGGQQQGQQGGQQQGQQGGQQQGQPAGGRGGEQAGRSNPDGSPATDGTRGGATRGNPIRTYTEDEIRQFAREFEERYRQGVALRDALREGGQDVADLDRALEAMQELRNVQSYQDLPQIQALREVVRENLGRVEFSLRRLVEGESAGRAAIRGSSDVPPGFEQLVEEYYRNLARTRSGGGGG